MFTNRDGNPIELGTLKERTEEDRPLLELLRDNARPLPPRERPDAAWVLRTGEALKSIREERGLTRRQLAERIDDRGLHQGNRARQVAGTTSMGITTSSTSR